MYIPSAPRVDYSLLIMASVEMMKMATGDDLPPPAGYWNISRLVFHRYRELRWWSGESRVISDGFYIYRIFWRWFHAKVGHEVRTIHQGVPGGPGTPWWVVPTSWLFWPSHEASSASFVPKNRQKVSGDSENFHILHKNNTTVVLLKTMLVRVSSK